MIVGPTIREKGFDAGYNNLSEIECFNQLAEYDDHPRSDTLKSEWVSGYKDGCNNKRFDELFNYFMESYGD